MSKEITLVSEANDIVKTEFADPATFRALAATTFSAFSGKKNAETSIKQACLAILMQGWSFTDIVAKRVYALPYGDSFSIIQSIADCRIKASQSGYSGKSAPIYTETDNKGIETCTITVYKKGGHPDGYTATVYFSEYTTGYNQWKQRPRTMIAKVAEMHALRMAFPEVLSEAYVAEEFDQEPPLQANVINKEELLTDAPTMGALNIDNEEDTKAKKPAEAKKAAGKTIKKATKSEIEESNPFNTN